MVLLFLTSAEMILSDFVQTLNIKAMLERSNLLWGSDTDRT